MPSSHYQAPRGTQDILPEDAHYWTFIEDEARRQAALAGFSEIRTPTFEDTNVFVRGVGATTDIVEKEINSFVDKGGDHLTLRPEGTAATVRAYLEHGMSSRPQPVKLFSLMNVFRRDKPQAGRYREFHQLNLEALGEDDPAVDAELVAFQWRFYAALGLGDLSLQVNSIGDAKCRPAYLQALTEYFAGRESELCEDCQRRLKTNPLRLLDEKNPRCQLVIRDAPRSTDYLCDECREHFQGWLGYLQAAGIPYTENSQLVRGLDYYTRSVWEIWPPREGAQSTLGAGGRYDGLAEELGGRHTPGVGFATGIERIILELKDRKVAVPASARPLLFLVYQGTEAKRRAFGIAQELRAAGIAVDLAFGDRKLGRQITAADRAGARFAAILGEDELAQGAVSLKDLRNGQEQRTVPTAELLTTLQAVAR